MAKGGPHVTLAGGGTFECVRGVELQRVDRDDRGALRLALDDSDAPRLATVDHLFSLVGFRPDATIYSELHVHQCYASDGPMKLAATLLAAAAGGGGGDCLKQAAPGVATLLNPEPNFYILGMKSYGRNSSFLMRVGFEQVGLLVDDLAHLAKRPPLEQKLGRPDAPQDDATGAIPVPVSA